MAVFLVLLIPVLLMVFALLMERLENRLHTSTMSEQDVEEFLEQAQPEEVNTFIREGWSRALDVFRLRRRRHGSRSAAVNGKRSTGRARTPSPAEPAASTTASAPAPPAPRTPRQPNP